MQRSFWSNWFKPATGSSRKWTLEELSELYEVLLHNGVVTEHNRAVVVETIRTIAEYILWGDQNEPRIFDFFLENNILTYLHKVLLQPSNRTGEVAKQVLQTLSIIIQNVRSETGIFFLFSNNHINNIVDLDFDFSDEEVLGYYISFLKTISLKLNAGTVHFFLNSSSTGRGFPLYTRAIRLAHNREGMVRAAVRTLTLNVYSVADADIHTFVTSHPASHYFTEVAQYLAEQVQLLDRHLSAAEAGGSQALSSLDSQLAETEDVLAYVSDLLSLGVPSISQLLASSMWQWVVRPLLLRPLMQSGAADAMSGLALNAAGSRNSSSSRGLAPSSSVGSPAKGTGHFRHFSWGSGTWGPDAAKQSGLAKVRPVCSVFVLERVFLLVSYQPLLQQLLLALSCGSPPPSSSSSGSSTHPLDDSSSRAADASSSDSSSTCRACLLGMLTSGQPLPVFSVLRLLVAVANSKHMPTDLLAALGILPRKQQQEPPRQGSSLGSNSLEVLVQQLEQQLQAVSGAANGFQQQLANGPVPGISSTAADKQCLDPLRADLLMLLTEQYLPSTQANDSTAAARAGPSIDGSSDGGASSSGVDCLQGLDQWLTTQQQEQQAPGFLAAAGSNTFASFGPHLLSALMPLLQLPSLPPMGLWLVGWLLYQLLPVSAVTGAAATAHNASPPAAAGAAGQHHTGSLHGAADDASDAGHSSAGISRSHSSSSASGGGSRHLRGSSTGGADQPELQQQASGTSEAAELHGAGLSSAPPLSTVRAVSVQSSLGFEPRASVLSGQQQQLLQDALDAAHAGFAQQVSSMWCEATFPLLALEWPAAREMLLRPVLRAGSTDLLSGTAVWPVLQSLQQQQRQPQQRQGGLVDGQSVSAQAALDCYLAVQRVVALAQIQELLRVGYIACSPPVATVSEADLKQVDIQEGYQVDLAPGSALPCVVSFAPGQERRVYFAVAGLSKQQLAALQGQADSTTAAPAAPDVGNHDSSTNSAAAAVAAARHSSLLRSLPVAVLADPSPSRPQAGVVLSVAPLLGARPYTDHQVGKWLHVHVRPSVRGLLRIIKTAAAKKGGLLSAMRQLADGHWVLAFSSADKASLAVTLVQQHATRLQALYGDALAPLSGAQQRQQPGREPAPQADLQQPGAVQHPQQHPAQPEPARQQEEQQQQDRVAMNRTVQVGQQHEAASMDQKKHPTGRGAAAQGQTGLETEEGQLVGELDLADDMTPACLTAGTQQPI